MFFDLHRIPNFYLHPFPRTFRPHFPPFQLSFVWWSLTRLCHAISRMASPSDKRFTIVRYLNSRANPLSSNDVPPASGNRSTSGNTQDSSTPKNEITAKSRRERRYSDTEGDGRTDESPDEKRLAFTRPGVGYDIRKAELSPRNDLYPFSERASTGVTAEKEGASDKLRRRRHSDVDGADDVSQSQLRRQDLSASTRPGLRQSTSSVI